MIIGIVGKKQAGKDTIGKLIEYIIYNNLIKDEQKVTTYKKFIKLDNVHEKTNWQIKKFATKIKNIVCLILGCSIEQLENEEFKDKELGREWLLPKEAGIKQQIRMQHLSFDKYITPRTLLQIIGTECGRESIHPDIWINALFVDNEPTFYKSKSLRNTPHNIGFHVKANYPNWIITDCRFINEAKAIKQRKGILIRKETNKESTDTHLSEVEQDQIKVDYTIPYCDNIEKLIPYVRDILIKEKII